jgi:metallo-beta-lactamase family protein
LRDSAEIQAEDAALKKKRHAREGRLGQYPETVLYSEQDVDRTMPLFRNASYRQPFAVTDAISATFYDAGHILGSAMLELQVNEGTTTRSILFSGDIGQWNKPIIRDPTLFEEADYVVMESTYGDRNHEISGDVESQLAAVIHDTVTRGGNLVIPTFAVERAQELLYYFGRLIHAGRIPDLPVYLDSPMSVDVTEVFRKFPEYFDAETWQLIRSNVSPLKFPGLRMARTADESKAINRVPGTTVIMASSGMCNAGRIKHHLKQNISRPESTILFVGFQSHGTLGRQILDGQRDVRIHGQMYRVKANIAQVYGFSGHADRNGLLRWIGNLRRAPAGTFLTHGEVDAANSLAGHIQDVMKWPVSIPAYQDVVELK